MVPEQDLFPNGTYECFPEKGEASSFEAVLRMLVQGRLLLRSGVIGVDPIVG